MVCNRNNFYILSHYIHCYISTAIKTIYFMFKKNILRDSNLSARKSYVVKLLYMFVVWNYGNNKTRVIFIERLTIKIGILYKSL